MNVLEQKTIIFKYTTPRLEYLNVDILVFFLSLTHESSFSFLVANFIEDLNFL